MKMWPSVALALNTAIFSASANEAVQFDKHYKAHADTKVLSTHSQNTEVHKGFNRKHTPQLADALV